MIDRSQDVKTVVTDLRRTPETLSAARANLPPKGGFYTWWCKRGALPHVPSRPHPTFPGYNVLYVGIAPSGPSSRSTLRSRVIGNHLRGNIAASTFRLTLACLLRAQLELTPLRTKTKVVLPFPQNQQLNAWQETNLMLTWHAVPRPWELEPAVICSIAPPLNLDDNAADPFYATLKTLRRAFRAACLR